MASPPHLVHRDDVPARAYEMGELAATRRRLGRAAGATRVGLSEFVVPPGRRATPVHAHGDEEELFVVTAGAGWLHLAGNTHAVRAGDCLSRPDDGRAHAFVAGPEGLGFLAYGEGSRSGVTYLPRADAWFLSPRWLPSSGPHPFQVEAALGPLELGEPAAERPPGLVALDAMEVEDFRREGYEQLEQDIGRETGSVRIGLRRNRVAPGRLSCPPHWHAVEEELFLVQAGSGLLWLGDERHALRPGHVVCRPPSSGVAHAFEAGPDGLDYLAFGTRHPHELCYYPRSGKALLGGLWIKVEAADYWDGEEGGKDPR